MGARVETREETSGDWVHSMERAVVGRRGRARPAGAPRASPLSSLRRTTCATATAEWRRRCRSSASGSTPTPVYAPNGKDYCSPLESPHNLIIQASCVGDVDTVAKCLDAGVQIDTR